MKFFFNTQKKNPLFWIYAGIMFLLLFLLPFLAKDAGMSGDEDFQYKHAESVLNYYQTFGKDTTAIAYRPEWNLPQYGQVVDNFASLLARVFHIEDVMLVRHLVNSLCGWIIILLVGLICFRISKKWLAAIIGSALMLLSPRFLGHSFNDIKDVSFAMFMIMGIYYMIVYFQTFPKVKKSTIAMLTVSIGLAIAVRVGGLLLIPFFGLFCIVYFIANYSFKGFFIRSKAKYFGNMIVHGFVILLGGYVLALLLWPYALVSPIGHVKETFNAMANFGTAIRQLFEGSLMWSDSLPWYYTPKYIFMTVPIAVITGWLLYSFVGGWKKENCFFTFILFFAFLFPVFWLVYTHANVYGGWRHAMFAYPPMVAAAGLGFNALIDFVKLQITNYTLRKNPDFQLSTFNFQFIKIPYYLVVALPFFLLILPALHVIRNHPYEYVYFNELAGGVKNAYGNYEMDYYFHSTREATEWVIKNAQLSGLETGKKIKVGTWHTASVNYFLRHDTARFQPTFIRWYERGNNDWDYAIFVITGMAPEQIKSEQFPPKNTIHTIEVDGKPICVILKRDDKSDLKGFQYKQKNSRDTAEYELVKALTHDPYNDAALMNLIELYLQTGHSDSAKILIDRGLTYIPNNETLLYFSAYYHLGKQEIDQAIENCETIIRNNFKFRGAYHLLTSIYIQKQDIKSAEKTLIRLIDADQMDEQGMRQLVAIYQSQGMNDRSAYKKLYRVISKSLEKRGKKKEAKEYADLAKRV
ncbi:MAG: phospholipid carrier-dependent glycosyltransferase [Prevotella sp.]|jgi:tetratricopeptide (TPR) repeat protein|nr:phospholipid carrier-dependent glycosyltransferase [Prevotella sp.]